MTKFQTILAPFAWILGMGLALFTLPAQAGQQPKNVISKAAEDVRQILREKTTKGTKAEQRQKDKLKKVVDEFLDYRELSRRALGPHWKDRSDEEKSEFTDLLRELIEASYTGSIRDNVDFKLEIEEEELAQDNAGADVFAVASSKNSKGKTVSEDLTFHLYLHKDKRVWMIYDVEFGDVSLVRHYRGEFNRKIKKESYQALLTTMRGKLRDVKAGKLSGEIDL